MQQKNYPAALIQFTAIPEAERDLTINNVIGYLYLVQAKFSEAIEQHLKRLSPKIRVIYQRT